MKKIIAIFISIILVISGIPTLVFAVEADKPTRYSVLVLDVCGEAQFLDKYDNVIYTADSAINYVKESAKTFLADLIKANGDNYVAVVTYSDYAQVITDFTNDINKVTTLVDSLSSNSNVRNLSDGLNKADSLLSSIPDNATKNVILVTTGMVNAGDYSYSGIYNDSVVGSSWRRTDTQVRLYAYANSAYNCTTKIKERANLYVLGLFQTMEGMPDEGKDIARFFRTSAKDFASSDETFYEIENPSDIGFFFGEISDDIIDTNISANVYNHINFIKSGNFIYNFTNSDVFERVNHIAHSDKGIIAREAVNALKYYLDIFNISNEDYFKSLIGDLTDSELVAQAIVTELLSSEVFKTNITNAEKTGVNTADEQLLTALKINASYFSVNEADKQQIEILLNDTNKSSADYNSRRTELLNRYYSSNKAFTDLSDIVGLATDANELLETFDTISYKNAKHMAEPTENEVFKQVKIFSFLLSEEAKTFSTLRDIKFFYENVTALTSVSYATQESLLALKENLIVSYYELGTLAPVDIRGEYVSEIISYIDKIQKAFGEHYNDYGKEKMADLRKELIFDTGKYLVSEGIDEVLGKICPEAKIILSIPGITCDAFLILGGLFTNVDERTIERNYTLAMGMVFEALADAFYSDGSYGYFAKKVINDKTNYSVELYETGLTLYKSVANMYEKHAEKYLAMLMDSKNLSNMAENILLPEDYEDFKKLSLFADKKKPVLSQLVVDSYSLNIWGININNLSCHDENNNAYVNPVTKKKYYLIACPVDVVITNNNVNIANVTNNQLKIFESNSNVRVFSFVGEDSKDSTKALLIPYDYDVKISGNGEGKMSVQKTVIDNGDIIDFAIIDNIPVKSGIQYSEVIDGEKLVSINGFDENGKQYSENDKLINGANEKASPDSVDSTKKLIVDNSLISPKTGYYFDNTCIIAIMFASSLVVILCTFILKKKMKNKKP